MFGWLRRSRETEDAEELTAHAAVHDYGEELEALRPTGWSDRQWNDFWWVVGSCGKKTCEQIVTESADGGGIVFTASHAWAQTVADAPSNVLHYVDGQWECVKPSYSVDAATVHRCVREIHSDCGEFDDLVYNSAFGLASVGEARAFTYRTPQTADALPNLTDYYQVATPSAIAAIRDRATGEVSGFEWARKSNGTMNVRVQTVKSLVWSHPGHDKDPIMVWKPACKWIDLYDKLCALLEIQVGQNSLGGLLFFAGLQKGETPSAVAAVQERLDEVRAGKLSTDPIIGGGSVEPKFIEMPNVLEVIFNALPVVARQIAWLGPIELGTLADGEVSGSHWAAAFRERHNLARLVGTMRKRVDRYLTAWALRPKLEELAVTGQLDSDPRDWMLGHDLDAIANRTDNFSDMLQAARLGGVSLAALRRTLRLKESDAPSEADLELIKCFIGRSPSEIRDFFGDYDEDRSDVDRREVGAEVFGRDPGPDVSGSVPAPVQRAAASVDPYGGFLDEKAGDPYAAWVQAA